MFQDEGSPSSLQIFSLMSLSPPWLKEMRSEERGLCLIHLLIACANHVAAGSIENANAVLECMSNLAAPDGDTMQRIAAYFTEALADRTVKAWPGLHKALNSTKIDSVAEGFLAQKLFFDLCPFLKLFYVITNQKILEAMEGEKLVHIIDLNSFEPSQWITLLQTLPARPEGPPHLRITGVHSQKEVLDHMARCLNEEAEKLDIPFQFNPIISKLENLNIETLPVKMGEAVGVTSVLQLHSLLADDNNLTRFLNGLRGLSPKIMVVTEQESNHNGFNLTDRVMEALNFYAALFDCLESMVPRGCVERLKIEKMFGEEIKNIVACEGVERKERHERLGKWIRRFELSGFGKVDLSFDAMVQGRRLLQSYGFDGCKVKDETGSFMICWQDQLLFSVSAWQFRR